MQASPPIARWIPGGRISEYAVTNGDFAAFAPIEFGERSLRANVALN